jgi:hypothetical protein
MPAAMRRLARHLLTFVSAVSLLLCVAVCMLWVQSYRQGYLVGWWGESDSDPTTIIEHRRDLAVSQGTFGYSHFMRAIHFPQGKPPRPLEPEGPVFVRFKTTPFPAANYHVTNLGVAKYLQRKLGDAWAEHVLLVPLWAIAIVSAILPGWWVVRYRRRRLVRQRQAANLCLRCGYDLRGSAGRCPECGTAPNQQCELAPGRDLPDYAIRS